MAAYLPELNRGESLHSKIPERAVWLGVERGMRTLACVAAVVDWVGERFRLKLQ
jgi:hypothetical protein